ncbi:hypothetical protein R4P64_07835 [Rhodococcus sp. IEGM 1366]|uniref:DUF7171 family protein n=1 Tax=Rhodococcus sp. IEGM 1366 TaxID=3082223 RepID=UPI002954C92F|nr:hypothetical protein [Rhodococcus sp. IEGM 1366]MDV8066411.1 hypothetical protein [Rhodococcus sp. IEGM 1366]
MNAQPLIDSARLQFSGLSAEDFEDVPEIGEQRTYTILATCQSHTERAMANEGTRKSVNMKVVRVLSGVDKSIAEDAKAEPSLFDTPQGDDTESEDSDTDSDEPDTESEGDDTDSADSETPSNVTAFTGPQFSAGE